MTTPTREQLVQWEFGEDNDGWYVSENGEQIAYGMSENVADKIVHLNNSRADLEATIAEQAAEIERLLKERGIEHDTANAHMWKADELRQQLAEAQAREQVLLDANRYGELYAPSGSRAQEIISKALSQPTDSTALHEWGARLVAGMLGEIRGRGFNELAKVLENKIRKGGF